MSAGYNAVPNNNPPAGNSQTAAQGQPPPPPNRVIGLGYELPKAVDALRQGWVVTYNASAVVASLFIATEASLLTLLKTGPDDHNRTQSPRVYQALVIFSYAVMIFSTGAIVSALVLVDQLGALPYRNRMRTRMDPDDGVSPGDILGHYNLKKALPVYWYICLILGGLCFITQILFYCWYRESNVVAIVVTVLTVVPLIPFYWVIRSD